MMSTASARDDLQMVRAALAYAERGVKVFPCYEITPEGDCACPPTHKSRDQHGRCGSPGKHPRTRNGVKDATTDPDTIRRLFSGDARHANIGGAMGDSGYVAIDVDPRNGGDDSLADLQRDHGTLAETPIQHTGGGGVHYVYLRPELPHVRGPRNGLGRGIDVKADGGYILLAPSNHLSGKSYTWDHAHRLGELAVAPLPTWILAQLDQRQHQGPPSTGDVLQCFLGRAFQLAGWLDKPLGPGKAAARCPWEDEHSTGSRYNGSTIVFSAQPGHHFGWWHCSHNACQGRTTADVLAALPLGARDLAKQQLGLPADYDGSRERRQATQSPNAPQPQQTPSDDPDEAWRLSLRYGATGSLTRDPGNAALLLSNLPDWRGVLEYDAFADQITWARPVPPLAGFDAPLVGDDLADRHLMYVQHWLARQAGLVVSREAVRDALVVAARTRSVHPLQSYLSSLQWDGTPRLRSWLAVYLRAADDDYTRAVGTWWMVSAVARAYRGGCQADHVLILEGPQGAGKTETCRLLAGDWYLGSLPDLGTKDAQQLLQGRWIVEIGELDALKGKAATRIKDFLVQTHDTYRPPYGYTPVKRQRHCVFIGTTNEHGYLRDATGARRFWPVEMRRLDRSLLRRDRDQLWAEARHLYEEGAPWWPSSTLEPDIAAAQEERYEADEWEAVLREHLLPEGDEQKHALTGITVGECLSDALKIVDKEKWTPATQQRVGAALRRLGFAKPKDGRRRGGSRVWMPQGGLSP